VLPLVSALLVTGTPRRTRLGSRPGPVGPQRLASSCPAAGEPADRVGLLREVHGRRTREVDLLAQVADVECTQPCVRRANRLVHRSARRPFRRPRRREAAPHAAIRAGPRRAGRAAACPRVDGHRCCATRGRRGRAGPSARPGRRRCRAGSPAWVDRTPAAAAGHPWLRPARDALRPGPPRGRSRRPARSAGAGCLSGGHRLCGPAGRPWGGDRAARRRPADDLRAGHRDRARRPAGRRGQAHRPAAARPRGLSGRRVPALGAASWRRLPGPADHPRAGRGPAAPGRRPPTGTVRGAGAGSGVRCRVSRWAKCAPARWCASARGSGGSSRAAPPGGPGVARPPACAPSRSATSRRCGRSGSAAR